MSLRSALAARPARDPRMISIRAERADDAPAVRRVHEAAFPTSAEADLVERLRATGRIAVSLVAEAEGKIIGHVVFSPVTCDPPLNVIAYGLGPLAVLPGHEKHAAGRRLVQNGLAECHARDACMVVVLGDFAYYSRFGFERASRHGLRSEYGVEDSFLVFMLEASAHPPPTTLVKYAAEFKPLAQVVHL